MSICLFLDPTAVAILEKEASLLLKQGNLPLLEYTPLFPPHVTVITAKQAGAAKTSPLLAAEDCEDFRT